MHREYVTVDSFPMPLANDMLTTQRQPSFDVIFTFLKLSFFVTIGKHFALDCLVTTFPLEQNIVKSQVTLSRPEDREARKGHLAFFA